MSKLFDGSRLSNWSSRQSAAADRVREDTSIPLRVPGGAPWLRFEIQRDDVDPAGTSDQRSEVLAGSDNQPPSWLNDGKVVHIVESQMFQSPFPVPGDGYSTSDGHSLYAQLKRSTGSPQFSLDGSRLNSSFSQFELHYGDKQSSNWKPSHVPHTADVMHDWIISIGIGQSAATGWLEFRHKLSTETDYKIVFPRLAIATSQAATNYLKSGYYRKRNVTTGRKGEQKTGVVRHSGYAVYSTLQEALDHFAGTTSGGGTTAPPPDPTPGPVPIIPVDTGVQSNQATVFANYETHATATDDVLRPDKTIPPAAFPHYTVGTAGAWATQGASFWAAGFYPSFLWLLYERTGAVTWRTMAEAWTDPFDAIKSTDNQDLTLQFITAMEAGYRLTGRQAYKAAILTAASTMTGRWDETIGAIRSWTYVAPFNTIIDSLENMETLFWAARNHTDPTIAAGLYNKALRHGQKVQANHIRANGSTYHVVEYDAVSGASTAKRTHQGYANESTWARGQAWAILGFAMYHRETRAQNPTEATAFLASAKKCAAYFLDNLPADGVPRWDFDAPATDQQKDTSAAAITAAGLLELAQFDGTRDWRTAGKKLLDLLASDWAQNTASASKAVHAHSVSNKPANTGVDAGYAATDYYAALGMGRLLATTPNPNPTFELSRIDVDFANLGDSDLNPALKSPGGVTVAGGSAQLRVDSSTRTARFGTHDLTGVGKVAFGGDLATIQSGTGDLTDALTMVIGAASDNNRAVIRKHIKNDTGALVHAIECRIVEGNAASVFSVDLGPLAGPPPANATDLAAARAFALGKSSDGKTVNFLFSTDWTEQTRASATWKLIVSKAFTAALFATTPVHFERVLDLISGAAVVTVSTTERLYGEAAFTAGGGTVAAPATGARTFDGVDDMLVFPAPPAGFPESWTMVLVARHLNDTGPDAPAGFARSLSGSAGSGKYVRQAASSATIPGQITVYDPLGSAGGRGAGAAMDNNDFAILFISQSADGYVLANVYDSSEKAWRHGTRSGPFVVSAAVPSTGKFIVGAPYQAATTLSWAGEIAMAGYTLKELTQADREACVSSDGLALVETLKAKLQDGLTAPTDKASLYDLTGGAPATQVQDLIGTRHQDLASSVGSTVTTGLVVPVAAGTVTAPPPTGTTVADPAGLTIVLSEIDPADSTKSRVSLKQDPPPAADLAAGVTFVYQRFVADDVSGGEWVQVATAATAPTQAAPLVISGQPRGEPVQLRALARIGAASSGPSNEVMYTIAAAPGTLPDVSALSGLSGAGGPSRITLYWNANPSAEQVTGYQFFVKPGTDPWPVDPTYDGPGTTTTDGLLTVTFTGLANGTSYSIRGRAYRQ